jgi:hypothetical protein
MVADRGRADTVRLETEDAERMVLEQLGTRAE